MSIIKTEQKGLVLLASKLNTIKQKKELIRMALESGIKLSKQSEDLYIKDLICKGDVIYEEDGVLHINPELPFDWYKKKNKGDIKGYNDFRSALISYNTWGYYHRGINVAGLYYDIYFDAEEDQEVEVRYVLLNGMDVTEVVDMEIMDNALIDELIEEESIPIHKPFEF